MSVSPPRQPTRLGADDLLQDIFGLNIQALRTVGTTIFAPRKIFEAARDDDWNGRYTPSLRLVFSLLALLSLLSFFWAGEDSSFFQQLKSLLETMQTSAATTEQDLDTLTDELLGYYVSLLPFAFLMVHMVLSQVVRIWGPDANGILRLRFYFAAIVPSYLLTVFYSLSFPLLDEEVLTVTNAAFLLVAPLVDVTTALRGGVAGRTRTIRVSKALLFGLVVLLGALIANLAAGIAMGFLSARG